ncbi:MAG: M23 family metallopeptidase [Candidatus Eisenbacteria bacterium]|uniref:M23 family metallopeptidase n=1 Tax=Eiseniibacteriota bacterium TaxID=2212470 RepID=A0A849SQE9_UNCEI|nr:M23 family metallopeptidase [Candidatus Eisenbacteria bacterium]
MTRMDPPARAAACLLLLAFTFGILGADSKRIAGSGSASTIRTKPAPRLAGERAIPFDAPLGRAPLDTPLTVTGGFGEFRIGHFHAGLDFGTGRRVGAPVYAPLDGYIERVRTSGVGYGRSLYLRTRDGRTIQFGHLDAFTDPIALYAATAQESSGQYEQDLWPEANRFAVKTGDRIAWTGQSGAGGPHMHFEIRRGDVAYNPFLAGLRVNDATQPSLVSVTLAPLDDSSHVEGVSAPRTFALRAAGDTIAVRGRLRVVIAARDGVWEGVDRMVPWLVRMEWGERWVECRMDSISWATEMNESDFLYDNGRIVGDKGIVLWAAAGFRPRFIRASEPPGREVGTLEVPPGSEPLRVRLLARDVSGNQTSRWILLRPDARPAARRGAGVERGAMGGTEARTLAIDGEVAADFDAGEGYRVKWQRGTFAEPATIRYGVPALRPPLSIEFDARLAAPMCEITPTFIPLRRALSLAWTAPEGARRALYRWDGSGWSFVGSGGDSANGHRVAESRRLGTFALLADTLAPRVTLRKPSVGPRKPYSRWELEAGVVESASGVDARESYFMIEGKRVPTEWDSEADALRWRPRVVPAAGTYRITVVVTDRAGNARTRSGVFSAL